MLFKQLRSLLIIPVLAAVTLLGMAGQPAHAQGISGTPTGTFVASPAPSNVKQGHYLDNPDPNHTVTAFTEQQNLVLITPLSVDINTPGTYSTDASITGGIIPTGTDINSFYFYSDPTDGKTDFTGSIAFDSNILGLEVLSSSLDNTDTLLGLPTTIYPNGDNLRGLEFGRNKDAITFDPSLNSISWAFKTNGNVDGVRVITASSAVPEPTIALPLGLMLLTGLVLWRRRSAHMVS